MKKVERDLFTRLMKKWYLSLFFIIILLLIASCLIYLSFPPRLETKWNRSLDEKIVVLGFTGEVDYNYIPDVQIWGDGHIIWVQHRFDGSRRVLEGYLSEREITNILMSIIDAGFFDEYSRFDWDVNAGHYLGVGLSNLYYRDTIDSFGGDDNQRILDLVNFLKDGAGVSGDLFLPEKATLLVFPIEETEYHNDTKANYKWPTENFGYGLEAVYKNRQHGEIFITGEELEFAWEIVNSPKPLVVSDGKIYWIAVRIPQIGI